MAMPLKDLRNKRIQWMVVIPIFLAILCLFGMLIMNNQRQLQALQQEEDELHIQLTSAVSE